MRHHRLIESNNQMAQLLVIYNKPTDPAAFDRHYRDVHVPLAKKIPGVRSFGTSDGTIKALAGSAAHLVAWLEFDSMDELNAALASSEGQATAADVANFASGGATLMTFDTRLM